MNKQRNRHLLIGLASMVSGATLIAVAIVARAGIAGYPSFQEMDMLLLPLGAGTLLLLFGVRLIVDY